jgi:hypothetical protein
VPSIQLDGVRIVDTVTALDFDDGDVRFIQLIEFDPHRAPVAGVVYIDALESVLDLIKEIVKVAILDFIGGDVELVPNCEVSNWCDHQGMTFLARAVEIEEIVSSSARKLNIIRTDDEVTSPEPVMISSKPEIVSVPISSP